MPPARSAPTAQTSASLAPSAAKAATLRQAATDAASAVFALWSRARRKGRIAHEAEDDARQRAREAANAIVLVARRATFTDAQKKTLFAAYQLATAAAKIDGLDDPMLPGQLRALGKQLSAFGVDTAALAAFQAPVLEPPPAPEIQLDTRWRKTEKPSEPEGVIQATGGWQTLRLTESDIREVERRDRDKILAWSKGYRPSCPKKIRKYKVVDAGADEGYSIKAYIKQGDAWQPAGELVVKPAEDAPWQLVSEYSNVPLHILAECDGMGNEMYRLAADEACRRGGQLTGSNYRSPFSEHFWKKQIARGRAGCDMSEGGEAQVYEHPLADLYEGLIEGTLSVPLYNKIRSRLESPPPGGSYRCRRVPMLQSWCDLPDKDRLVRNRRTSRRKISRRRTSRRSF
jgi:hypothetical protein